MDDGKDVITVSGANASELWPEAFARAERILGTVPLVTLISATHDGEQWTASYTYRPMFPLANPPDQC